MIKNQKAIDGIKFILGKFAEDELFALAATVTQGLLKNKLKTRHGAVHAIIVYSQDVISFLRRKSVTRDCLFDYLHENGLDVRLPVTKDKLIKKIVEYWQCESEVNIEQVETNESIDENVESNEEVECNENRISTEVLTEVLTETQLVSQSNIDVMAIKFAEWFYTMMNQSVPMGTEHFYSDANLKINLINNDVNLIETSNELEEIVELLFKTKQQFNLFFNPNICKDGVKGKMDPHGLVVIMACGTLHVDNLISGVFEQVFALARDPFCENNWKIKRTELVLRSSTQVQQPPRLCDNTVLLEINET